tara:strand:- start:112 stop:1869 length:1758 start_codon:yes stop_codon:yes gene_type:complete
MELTIEQALQQGIAAHKEGRIQDAERLYRVILQSQPRHPDANHNLGLLAVSMNKAKTALPLFKTALEANPKIEQFWVSYIDALIKEKQFDNAKQVLEQAKNQGVVEDRLNALEEKLSPINEKPKTAMLNPPQELLNSLFDHYQNGRFSDAEKLAKHINQYFPKHQFAWKVLGAVLEATGRNSEAVDINMTAVALSPEDAEAHSNLGNTLKELGRLEEAEGSYTQAIALKPDYAEAHSNLGNTLKELGRLDEAEASYTQAIALKPDFAEAHSNLGNTLKELDRLDEAEASYTQAIALKPNYAKALANRSHLFLDKGEYEDALRDADACTLGKKYRALPLISLYALGRISEIYKRLETQSKSDAENISLAAFAAFISEKEKTPTAYNFCPNPIDFIHTTNLSSHLSDLVAFVTGVIEELNEIKTIWEPSGKATVNGFQSLGGTNLFKNPLNKIAQLKSIIISEIEAYYLKFQNEQCTYMQQFPTTRNLFGWTVNLKQQGHQNAHIHSSGWLSGVIYLKVVPSLGRNEGAIEFGLNGKHYHDVDSPNLIFQPEVGDIVFFPSSLHHKTIPFTTDTDRIIVSFDLMPKG